MGETSRTFTINLGVGTGSPLELAAASLQPGQSVEFNSAALNAWIMKNYNEATRADVEPFVYWNNKFYWDDVNREAQGIGIGTYYKFMKHIRYTDSTDEWFATHSYEPEVEWGMTPLSNDMQGHPFEMHCMTPDGTYWVKRSQEWAFQYRKRTDWSSDPWPSGNRTPDFEPPPGKTYQSDWMVSIDYHEALQKMILRVGAGVMAFDTDQFLATGAWNYQQLPDCRPSLTSAAPDKCSMRYCRALQSMIFWGENRGAKQDSQYLLRADGTTVQLANKPPRWVMTGNFRQIDFTPDIAAIFVDDPLGQSGYLVEVQMTSSSYPVRVWKMRNSGTSWDGTWDEIGTTDVTRKPRADLKPIGTRCMYAPVYNYGVIWVIRQGSATGDLMSRGDSFLWKPPV